MRPQVVPIPVVKTELLHDLLAAQADEQLLQNLGKGRSEEVLRMEVAESYERLTHVSPIAPLLRVMCNLVIELLFDGILETSALEEGSEDHTAFRESYRAILFASVVAVLSNLLDKEVITCEVTS